MLTIRRPRAAAEPLRDRRGYYRSPVTLSSYHKGKPAPNKGMKLPAEPLSSREILALLEACGRGHAGMRDRALIVILWRAGLRIAEALALYPKDVDLEHGRVRVLHGKGDRARTVGLDPMACSVIEAWLEDRRELELTNRHALFCVVSKGSSLGQPVHSSCVRESFKRLAVKAGIETPVRPHGLRHTHAFELAEEQVPMHYIRRQLGHASLAVTARYIEHLNPSEVVEKMRARVWPEPPERPATTAGGPSRS